MQGIPEESLWTWVINAVVMIIVVLIVRLWLHDALMAGGMEEANAITIEMFIYMGVGAILYLL